jgi:hypothetical protein
MTKLTLDDRSYLSIYSRQLPCTLKLWYAINAFTKQIDITKQEIADNGITFDPSTGIVIPEAAKDLTTEFESFPQPVIDAMKDYLDVMDNEDNKKNVMIQKTFSYFRKIIG